MPVIQSLALQFPSPLLIDQLFRQVWEIVPDPSDREYIRAPQLQAAEFYSTGFLQGDCDDASTLAACLLVCLGWPCVITAIRRPGDENFSHVFTSASENGYRVDIDPVVPEYLLPIRDIEEAAHVYP